MLEQMEKLLDETESLIALLEGEDVDYQLELITVINGNWIRLDPTREVLVEAIEQQIDRNLQQINEIKREFLEEFRPLKQRENTIREKTMLNMLKHIKI